MLPLLRFMDFCTWWFRRFLGYLLKINSVLCISVLFNSAIVCAVGGGEGAERERGGGGRRGGVYALLHFSYGTLQGTGTRCTSCSLLKRLNLKGKMEAQLSCFPAHS